jgi:hypothetical protein
MKIFSEDDNRSSQDRVLYSECYVVKYRFIDKDGYEKTGEKEYFTASKGRNDYVAKKFMKDFGPGYRVVSVIYQ